jgi:vacuolar protein sorting-associated protein 16
MTAVDGDPSSLESYEDWHLLPGDETYFSKKELYQLDWDGFQISTSQLRLIPGNQGGLIAAFRDDSKVVLYVGPAAGPNIRIFSAAGKSIGMLEWKPQYGRIIEAGWTPEEKFIIVADTGSVYYRGPPFQPHASLTRMDSSSLGLACEEDGIINASIAGNSIAALTSTNALWTIEDINTPRSTEFPTPCPTGVPIHALVTIPPSMSTSGTLEVLVAIEQGIVVVDADAALPTSVNEGPLLRLAVSPCGKYVAGFSEDECVHIWTSDFITKIGSVMVAQMETDRPGYNREYSDNDSEGGYGGDGGPQGPPEAFYWCGSDGVVVAWEGTADVLLLSVSTNAWHWWESIASMDTTSTVGIGTTSGSISPPSMVTEVDGVRLITKHGHYLIRRIPDPLVSVLEIGSTSPAALLYDARRLYESGDARATAELLDIVQSGNLVNAVQTCIEAAATELQPAKQVILMRAASYGRAFLALQDGNTATSSHHHSTVIIDGKRALRVAQKLRIINALLSETIGMPLTMAQLDSMGTPLLLQKLVGRKHYLLALRIAEASGEGSETVLTTWACDKITTAAAGGVSDEELLSILLQKLATQPRVKFSSIAAHAQNVGRPRLAALLLDHETHVHQLVPLLLQLGEDERALKRAIEYGDMDLVADVLQMIRKKDQRQGGRTGSGRLWSLLAQYKSAAVAAFVRYYQQQQQQQQQHGGDSSIDVVVQMYNELHMYDDLAEYHYKMATDNNASMMMITKEVQAAKDAYIKAGAEFEASAVSQYSRMRELQRELEQTSKREGLIGLSVADTIRQCIKLGMKDQAQKVGREFKVPEKHFTMLSIETHAAMKDWQTLQHMAGKVDRRGPVSMEQFVIAAKEHGAPVQTMRWFIDRITGEGALVKKAQYYSEIGLEREAESLMSQAELAGGSSMLGSLRDAMVGARVFGSS